jgi:hypothetical protein
MSKLKHLAPSCQHHSGGVCHKLQVMSPPASLCNQCEHYKEGPPLMSKRPPQGVGLGDWVHHGIMFLSLGQGQKIARKISKAVGRKGGCGCKKRQEKLNELGEKIKGTTVPDPID